MRLQAETWLSEMKVEADATLVDGQRKEETFQVGWMILSQDRLDHYVTSFGVVTPHDSALGGPPAPTGEACRAVTTNHDKTLVRLSRVVIGDFAAVLEPGREGVDDGERWFGRDTGFVDGGSRQSHLFRSVSW